MPTTEREITEPVDLCGPDGRLNPAAVGWTRTPQHRANLRGWGRTKRWEYWGIVTPTHVVGTVLSSIDYAGVHGIYVLDRSTGEETDRGTIAPLARGTSLPAHCGPGTATAEHGGMRWQFTTDDHGTRLRVTAPDVELDVVARRDPGHESMGVVVPWSRRLFQYTVKDLALPVTGRLVLRGEEVRIEGPDAFAVLDHGRGRWPYRMTWNWAAGSGAGGRGIQLGGKWTEGTGSTENAVLVDGRLHKIGEELRWEYDRTDWLRPWRISGDTVDAQFHPFHERASRQNLGIVGSETHQCFGEWSGWATTDDGERVDLAGLVGWAEEARQRW